ncbi:MAG: ATP-binding cassette domain-containing protein [Actinobacteria bacterium]|nr:ATP-binding cassette domain-containing protein [Actinomycetota bacterium]
MRPFDPRLLKAAGQTRQFLAATVAIALVATVGTLGVAYSLTQFVVGIFVDDKPLDQMAIWLVWAVAAAALRALAHFLGELAGFRTARGIKAQFRLQAMDRIGSGSTGQSAGALSQLLGPGLDAIDGYFGKFLPQLVFAALVTPILIAVILVFDPISAISIIATLPLIPIFMVLIGLVTKDVQNEQLKATTALSAHFLEVLQGVTTLKIFGRIERQLQTLLTVANEQKLRTMKVLRLSFLSGFALELAASLSVALIAVQIGIRLVDGQMLLSVGLFVLLLAPEVYLPLRNVGAQFHNSQAGVLAVGEVLDLLEEKPSLSSEMAIDQGITVLVGPSGSGKTTRLRRLVSPDCAWVPQHLTLLTGTVLQNIAGFDDADRVLAETVLSEVGLEELDLEEALSNNLGVSGGQAQRLMIARALYRLRAKGLSVLLLDEPTSMLDEENQALIAKLISEIAGQGVRIAIATHQDSLINIADRVNTIEAARV